MKTFNKLPNPEIEPQTPCSAVALATTAVRRYNGMPNGCSDDIFEWKKDLKQLYVCHAEMNAILNKNVIDVKGCDLYVTRFPCNECAKVIIQSGISTIYFLEDKHPERQMYVAAKKMFVAAGVAVRQFTTDRKENIEIRLRISPKPQPEPQSESQPESQAGSTA
ncbi:deoxycytidylate deaminase isoform X2 [Spodoptera frugiperda]|uniref:dCMP deaminase n=1 Tax=Spodoptera frugiperda TaxID=7108 RepID=A0A9R0DSI6_SPOFR|nr:deoxycytidylate deaminase isoform X2 [Spodoptera frugiperda]